MRDGAVSIPLQRLKPRPGISWGPPNERATYVSPPQSVQCLRAVCISTRLISETGGRDWGLKKTYRSIPPFLSRLLLRLPESPSSLSTVESFLAESRLSQLICRLSPAGPSDDGRYSGVFFVEESGVPYCLGVARPFTSDAVVSARLTLVKLELTAVKPPEFMAVNPDVAWGVLKAGASDIETSRSESLVWPSIDACSASVACLAGDSARRLGGVCTLDRLSGLGAGLGVRGPPYSSSSCW